MTSTTLALNRMEFSNTRASSLCKTFFRKLGDKLLLVPDKPKEKYPNEFKYKLERLKYSGDDLKRHVVMGAEVATLDYRGKDIDPYTGINGYKTSEILFCMDPDRSIAKRIVFGIGTRAMAILPSAMLAFIPQMLGACSSILYSIGLGINQLRQLRTGRQIEKIEEQK